MASEVVITQDISSGRIHKRYPADSGYATHEADNLDDAGAYRILTQAEFEAIPVDHRCRRCWPEDDPSVQHTILTVGNESVTLP